MSLRNWFQGQAFEAVIVVRDPIFQFLKDIFFYKIIQQVRLTLALALTWKHELLGHVGRLSFDTVHSGLRGSGFDPNHLPIFIVKICKSKVVLYQPTQKEK